MAESGRISYACYGSRAVQGAERKLRNKMESDFTRALTSWPTFTPCFVTNAPAGPEALTNLLSIQSAHGRESERPIEAQLWNPDRLWTEVVSQLTLEQLNDLFPGAPGIHNVELADPVPLLDILGADVVPIEEAADIRPVPVTKMDFNSLSEGSRLENPHSGRRMAPRVDRWFGEAADPNLHDRQGEAFRRIYLDHRKVTSDPTELLERLYVSIGGPNIRLDGLRANAVYAVASYFFESCHIFDEPTVDNHGGARNAAPN